MGKLSLAELLAELEPSDLERLVTSLTPQEQEAAMYDWRIWRRD